MRLVSAMSCITAIALSLACAAATAQCAGSYQTNQINCNNPHTGCSGSVTQILPNFGQYGVTWACETISCCSATYPSCNQQGFTCGYNGKLADPMIRQHLIELARSEQIMINSCKGEFRPLEIALAEKPASKAAEPFDPSRARRTLPGVVGGGE